MAIEAAVLEVVVRGDTSNAEAALGRMDRKVGESGGSFARAGAAAAPFFAAVTVGTALATGAVLKLGSDTQSALNTFAAVTGASAEQMAAVQALARDLGNDLTLPSTSAADAAATMTELAKAGFSVEESMAAAKGVLQASTAAQVGAGQSAEIVGNALNSFALKGKDAAFVADLLAATANNSSVEMTDVAQSMAMAGAVFSSFQGPVRGSKGAITDLSAAIGILGNQGIKGSDAGTSLKQMLLQLTAPSANAKGLMRDLAARIGETGDIAYDAQGNMRPLREIIDLVARSTADMTQEQRDYNISQIFGADASRAVIALLKNGSAGWEEMTAAVSTSGAAADVAAAKTQGVGGALQGVLSGLETLAIDGFNMIAPYVEGFLRAISGVLANGPVLKAVLAGLTTVVGLAAGAWLILNAAILANPIVLVIGLLAGLVGALVYAYQRSDTFREIVTTAFAAVRDIAETVVGWFRENWPIIQAVVEEVFGFIWSKVQEVWPAIRDFIAAYVDRVRQVIEAVIGAIRWLWNQWGDDLVALVQKVWPFIQQYIGGVIDVIKGIFQVFTALLRGDWGKLWEGLVNIVVGFKDMIVASIRTMVAVIGDVLGGINNFIRDKVQAPIEGVVDWIKQLPGRIATAAKGMWDGIFDAFRGMLNAVIGGWNSLQFKLPSFDGLKVAGQTVIPGFTGPTLGVPRIPLLADGGVVTRPTLAMIGEAGPEAVIPLDRAGLAGGQINVSVTIEAPGAFVVDRTVLDDAARVLAPALQRALRDLNRAAA